MKSKALYFAALAIAILTLNACKKDDPSIIGTWKITAAEFTPPATIGGTTYNNAYPYILSQSCDQDNLFIFNDGNQVIEDEGANKCDSNDPQQTSATYLLSGSTLTVYGSDTSIFTGVTVGKEYLTGTTSGDLGGGITANIKVTWTRQ